MKRKKIVVYTDRNTATGTLIPRLRQSFHGVTLKKITEADLYQARTLDQNTLAFVLPGIIGEDSLYPAHIGAKGNEALRHYVEEGGIFIGVCAGAYYACREILYDPPWRAQPKRAKPGLDFFNGLARGSIPELGKKGDIDWFSDCTVVMITYKGGQRQTGIAYGNGPALYPDITEKNIEIMARYANSEGQPIAIAAKKIGKGLAIFIGVLPDIGYESDYDLSSHPVLTEFMQTLKPHEQGRREVWDMIISKVKQHHADNGRVTLYGKPSGDPAP
ncbi:MAG: hypothetical protein CO093_06155 [Alphaproteobacteria bacterium CG_4_9_14_3_um_filter_47_13]|nr:MAG: hypothetical protein CO093_06155 [Alphaproteobacteria bacterium CG_4_9_14_3_um_filter_47_13]